MTLYLDPVDDLLIGRSLIHDEQTVRYGEAMFSKRTNIRQLIQTSVKVSPPHQMLEEDALINVFEQFTPLCAVMIDLLETKARIARHRCTINGIK